MDNNKPRITPDLSMVEILANMSEGNQEALQFLTALVSADPLLALFYMLLLDKLGIYGYKIAILWKDCCEKDWIKWIKTLEAFRLGNFSKDHIHAKLELPAPTPFVE